MLPRTPEPELMTEIEQARAYAHADFAAPHDHFVEIMIAAHAPVAAAGVALDLGCGPADITIRVAKALPNWIFDGLDGSEAMLEFGRQALTREGLAERINLVKAFLPGDVAPLSAYDFVFSNSLLHHLHAPQVLWDAVRTYTKPHAPVLVMDLMRPVSSSDAERMVEQYSGNEPEILKRDFLNSLHAAFTIDEVREQLATAQLAHLVVEAVSDRHLTISGRR